MSEHKPGRFKVHSRGSPPCAADGSISTAGAKVVHHLHLTPVRHACHILNLGPLPVDFAVARCQLSHNLEYLRAIKIEAVDSRPSQSQRTDFWKIHSSTKLYCLRMGHAMRFIQHINCYKSLRIVERGIPT